jgi:hypothetical protein
MKFIKMWQFDRIHLFREISTKYYTMYCHLSAEHFILYQRLIDVSKEEGYAHESD